MTEQDVKRRLLDYLDEHAFGPVLRAPPEDFPPGRREQLEQVHRVLQRERERFHRFGSAEEVYRAYHADLDTDASRDLHRRLRDLGLPTLEDVRIDFEQMAQDLGVGRWDLTAPANGARQAQDRP